jgi:regulator of cell morphogenesis and NO signaling
MENLILIDASKVLDVTKIEPKHKHQTIFEYFDRLQPGESFIIHNDHDPKPLYYQLLGERGNCFSFDYLEDGPVHWHIEIKLNSIDSSTGAITVGEIAARDFRKAEVFKKFNIDYCCGGGRTVKEASDEVGVSEKEVQEALDAIGKSPDIPVDNNKYESWDIGFLADYIVNTHHRYVKETAEVLNGLAQKVAEHHHQNHPELPELAIRINNMLQEMLNHMYKEDQILFPAIKKLVASNGESENNSFQLGIAVGAIQLLKIDHDETGDNLRTFRDLTNDYKLPDDACNSYQYLFNKLIEFENDMFKHIHLENNILFSKVEKMKL